MSTRSLSRRQFLLSASHAALASSVLSCATTPETEVRGKKSTPALRLSTSSIHFHGRPVEDARERIARLGFGAVDIWSGYQGCPHLDDVKKRLGARRRGSHGDMGNRVVGMAHENLFTGRSQQVQRASCADDGVNVGAGARSRGGASGRGSNACRRRNPRAARPVGAREQRANAANPRGARRLRPGLVARSGPGRGQTDVRVHPSAARRT